MKTKRITLLALFLSIVIGWPASAEPPTQLSVNCSDLSVTTSDPDGVIVNTYSCSTSGGRGTRTITYNQAPGARFLVGVTFVTATASDKFGSVAYDSFSVTVNLTAPPPPPTPSTEVCGDQIDNDGDGLTDAADPDCAPAPPPPPPSSAPIAGPTTTITCPAGAVDIFPGQDIPLVMDANGSSVSFCIHSGTYSPTRPIRPHTGATLTCEFGAVIDGTNVNQSYDTGGIFIISGWNAGGGSRAVTVRNCIIRNHTVSLGCIGTTDDSWTVDHNEMGNCELGVNFYSANDVMTSNYVHHNTRGGYGIYHSLNPVVEGNEFAYNGGDQKAIDSWNVTFRNNFSHHNSATGFWCDGCDGYAIFGSVPTIGNGMIAEGNRVEDNAQYQGVMCEITPRCVIRNNTIKRNAIGVFVSSSHEADVYGNDLEDNFRGIEYFVYCDGLNTAQAIARGWDFYGNNAHDNSVRLTTKAQAGSYASLFSYTGCTSTQAAPYVNNVRQNNFTRNTYHMPDTGSYWYWVGTKSWSQWLALPQDIGGAVTIP